MKYCCERCLKTIDEIDLGKKSMTIRYKDDGVSNEIALCEECAEAFYDFMDEFKYRKKDNT